VSKTHETRLRLTFSPLVGNADSENSIVVIMALNPSLTKNLITTSVAVVLFAFVIGFADRKNVMIVNTAYATVLVVFVATSGTSGTLQTS
jgi:hypothetical protein